MFNIIVEAIVVGIGTTILYLVLPLQGYMRWFVLGVCKHGLSGILGLHDFYCRIKGTSGSTNKTLLLDSIGEGGIFVMAHFFIKDVWYSAFLLGVSLHLLFEVTGLHSYFVKTRCKK